MADQEMNPQQKLELFTQLMPVTLAIAGLPQSDHGKYYNDDQMEMRARVIRTAFKHAKLLMREVSND